MQNHCNMSKTKILGALLVAGSYWYPEPIVTWKFICEFRRPIVTSKAPKIFVLGMLQWFCIIRPEIDQIWAWLHRRQWWTIGVRDLLESLVTGSSLLVNCYLEKKFHNKTRLDPPPPPPPPPKMIINDNRLNLIARFIDSNVSYMYIFVIGPWSIYSSVSFIGAFYLIGTSDRAWSRSRWQSLVPVPDFTGGSGIGSGTGAKFSSGQVLIDIVVGTSSQHSVKAGFCTTIERKPILCFVFPRPI